MTEIWRFLPLAAGSGPDNMALDEALLTRVGDGHGPPTLRFYTWTSPWLSLGSGQSATELDRPAAAEIGWGIVRRSSGGTLVLHQGQVGYALVLPADHWVWRGDLVASYERLSEPLALAFRRLGASVEAPDPSRCSEFSGGSPALASRTCFGSLGPFELVHHGRKLIGNSQTRRRLANAQHGVIQRSGGQAELAEVILTSPTARSDLADYLTRKVGSLDAAIGRAVSVEEIAEAAVAALQECLGITLVEGSLAESERGLAETLAETKYRNPEWTFRR
jgi:lipoyl(octanoyl) transferase